MSNGRECFEELHKLAHIKKEEAKEIREVIFKDQQVKTSDLLRFKDTEMKISDESQTDIAYVIKMNLENGTFPGDFLGIKQI